MTNEILKKNGNDAKKVFLIYTQYERSISNHDVAIAIIIEMFDEYMNDSFSGYSSKCKAFTLVQ